jgi:hypothetical protein
LLIAAPPKKAILESPVRRILATLLVVLAVPAAASAQLAERGDGTLALRSVAGKVVLTENGTALGRIDLNGELRVIDRLDPNATPRDPADLQVFGADSIVTKKNGTVIYTGNGLRFRIVGGWFQVKIEGVGIDVSAVGKGTVQVQGVVGQYSANGAPFRSVPLATAAEVRFGQG